MSIEMIVSLCIAAAFLCGSVPFGYWAGKLKGLDIRQHGSGNIGATNVIRVCGKGIGIPVFILDMIKGLVPVLLPSWLLAGTEVTGSLLSATAVVCGLAAILGHMFTPWLGFKGGKGVATAAGVLLGIAPIAMLVALGAWLLFFFTSRYVSLASMAAAIAVPVTMAVQMATAKSWDGVLLGFGILLAILVVVRHRANIQRLMAGTESRVGKKKAS
jgi:acyl phosphate:glycerol-3-phosphate acyltransferase